MSSQRDTPELIPGKEETIIWTVYHVVIALLSLFGDSIILVGTTKYKAIKLHRVIVVVIQHLAAADLMLTFSRVVPIIVSLIGGGWVMGNFLCSVNFGPAYVVTPTMCMLTCLLVSSKLMIVQYPLRAGSWSRKRGHVICVAIWLSTFLLPTQIIFATEKSLYFDYIHYICMMDYNILNIPIWLNQFQRIVFGLLYLTIILLIISISVILLYKANKAVVNRGGSLSWQGVLPVILTIGVFFVSYLPDSIISGLVNRNINISVTAQRAASFMEYINIVANFFVYTLTVRSFREFLAARFREMSQRVALSNPTVSRSVSRSVTRSVSRSVRVQRGTNSSGANRDGRERGVGEGLLP